jgi:hypothetical protein
VTRRCSCRRQRAEVSFCCDRDSKLGTRKATNLALGDEDALVPVGLEDDGGAALLGSKTGLATATSTTAASATGPTTATVAATACEFGMKQVWSAQRTRGGGRRPEICRPARHVEGAFDKSDRRQRPHDRQAEGGRRTTVREAATASTTAAATTSTVATAEAATASATATAVTAAETTPSAATAATLAESHLCW